MESGSSSTAHLPGHRPELDAPTPGPLAPEMIAPIFPTTVAIPPPNSAIPFRLQQPGRSRTQLRPEFLGNRRNMPSSCLCSPALPISPWEWFINETSKAFFPTHLLSWMEATGWKYMMMQAIFCPFGHPGWRPADTPRRFVAPYCREEGAAATVYLDGTEA